MTLTYVVIVAGGSGTRMGTAIPKQFLELCGKPVLYHTINAFHAALPDAVLILVLPEEHISYAQMALQYFEDGIDVTIVAGGKNRYASVQNGLKVVSEEDAIVLVHDGVRPLVSKELILRCVEMADDKGCAIPVVMATDSMRMMADDGVSSQPISRERVRIVQTPQVFRADILLTAFKADYQSSFTDEATVVESAGYKVHFIAGEKRNLKITMPEDLIIAEALMRVNIPTPEQA